MNINIFQKLKQYKHILIGITAFIVVSIASFYSIEYFENKRIMEELAKQNNHLKTKPAMLFNLPIDSFSVVSGQIKSGNNLSDILTSKDIPMARIDELAKMSIPIFDVKKIKVDHAYYFFVNKKQPSKVDYFIYEIDPVNYIVYQLSDSLRIYMDRKPIETQVKSANGIITSSLWNTMKSLGLDPILAMNLSEVYAWSIDFFGIKKGDKFRIIYEENYAHGKSIGIGRILASQFVHANEDFYAFLFTQDNEDSYFDEKGKSLKKAFLKAPLKFSRISSGFTANRLHPILKICRPHYGIDYAAPTGTPVVSIGDGTVIAKAYQASGGGNYLKIKHNSEYTTSYMHLSKFGPGIASGVRVKQGQVIGYVGATGLASGPHLDFRVFQNGCPVNPLKITAPPTEPITEVNLKKYTIFRDSMMLKLNTTINS